MGYRSEVTLTMYKKDYEELLRQAIKERNNDVIDLIKYAGLYRKADVITMHWDWVKWYEECPDIKFVMDFILLNNVPYSFKRVGEETGDIEELSYDDEYDLTDATYVSCCIDLNDVGEMQDRNLYIDKIKTEIDKIENAELEPVSEDELFAVIAT